MKTMIGFCGLSCDTCQIHLASIEKDEVKKHHMRATIARKCREQYDMNLQPEDVNDCDGCHSQSVRLFIGCASCAIRKCVRERNLGSCAYCGDFGCDKLQKMFLEDSAARTRLEALRKVAS